ncbi:hypothetical protein C0Q70_05374 [Pomacea canaliculata]|uniref:LIM zinc-binding domain-containing protein n=1 Tax=Pomacea canaliculata TaxID=400727 RepID=A0A2T7PL09_POMCA|nr:hypothetical protein C0Q70_05374 [Pomacea canaliculata]
MPLLAHQSCVASRSALVNSGRVFFCYNSGLRSRQHAIQTSRASQVPQVRQVGLRGRGEGCCRPKMAQVLLQVRFVQQASREHQRGGARGRAVLQGVPRRKYGPKGYGFGGGAGALGMDKGERFGNVECEMDPGSRWLVRGASSSTGPKCPRCGKTVYDAERAIGSTVPWHKSCFNCKNCTKSWTPPPWRTRNEVYCKLAMAKLRTKRIRFRQGWDPEHGLSQFFQFSSNAQQTEQQYIIVGLWYVQVASL